MKTKLKVSLTSKRIGYFLMLLLMVVCTSCGGDDDEPDNDNDDKPELTTGISPSILPGTWVIESVTQIYTGKVIPIDKEFTILPFEVSQTYPYDVTKYSDGSEEWGEVYFKFTSVSTLTGTSYGEGGIDYYRAKGKNLKDAVATTVMLNFPNNNHTGTHGLMLSDMEYANGVLISKNGGFNFEADELDDDDYSYIGTVKLKKK